MPKTRTGMDLPMSGKHFTRASSKATSNTALMDSAGDWTAGCIWRTATAAGKLWERDSGLRSQDLVSRKMDRLNPES